MAQLLVWKMKPVVVLVLGGGQCHFKIDAKEGMQLFLRHHLGQCQE